MIVKTVPTQEREEVKYKKPEIQLRPRILTRDIPPWSKWISASS